MSGYKDSGMGELEYLALLIYTTFNAGKLNAGNWDEVPWRYKKPFIESARVVRDEVRPDAARP